MADYYLVTRQKGPAWDHSRGRREQAGWDEHAKFMDVLVEEGAIVLGGPVGEAEGEDVLLVFAMDSEAAIRAKLAEDPWPENGDRDQDHRALVGVAAGAGPRLTRLLAGW